MNAELTKLERLLPEMLKSVRTLSSGPSPPPAASNSSLTAIVSNVGLYAIVSAELTKLERLLPVTFKPVRKLFSWSSPPPRYSALATIVSNLSLYAVV